MKLIFAIAAASLLASAGTTAPCKDAKGRFTKCPVAAAASASVTKGKDGKCRNAKGHFTKCPK